MSKLLNEILKMPVPKSVAIIMDGNRRFAKRLMKKPWEGHKIGVMKARDVFKWACEIGIKYITIYTLSIENLKSRPKMELRQIFKYFDNEMDVLLSGDHIIHKTKTRVRFIGRIKVLPKKLQQKMKKIEHLTERYKDHFLNMAVAYGGRQEIIDACKKIAKKTSKGIIKPGQINENLIKKNLYVSDFPYPDLIIRTGGERRISNFLLWQSAYSELAFTNKKWPEMDKNTFLRIIRNYQKRERRFGK